MDLESLEFSNQQFTLDEFLDTYPLPQIVCVRDGYLDLDEITTLSTDQVMMLHFLKPCKMLKGFRDDKSDPDVSIPLSTQGTIEILPERLPKMYKSVKEMKNDMKETKTFVSLNSHAWLGIENEDILRVESCFKRGLKEFLRCSIVNKNHTIVDIPTSYKASFLSYEEPKKISIKEADVQCIFPCYVKIQGRAPTKPDYDPEDSSEFLDLSELGRIKLVGVYDYDKIVASIRHLEKVRIMQIPLTLPITVSTGKDVHVEESTYNHLCREVHQSTQFQQLDGMDYEYMKMGYSECKVDNIYEYIDARYLKLPMHSDSTQSVEYSEPKAPPPPLKPKPKLQARAPSIKSIGQDNTTPSSPSAPSLSSVISSPAPSTSSSTLPLPSILSASSTSSQSPSTSPPPRPPPPPKPSQPPTSPSPPLPSAQTTTPSTSETTPSSSAITSSSSATSPLTSATSSSTSSSLSSTEEPIPSSISSSSSSTSTSQANNSQETFEIPEDLKTLTVEGVANCLKYLHMGIYVEKFEEELIDGTMLVELTEDILEDSLGVSNSLHKKKLAKFIQGWRPK